MGAIRPPTVQEENGDWVIDINHRFFSDDLQYGLCIAKWIAEQLDLVVPSIDKIIAWAQELLGEKFITDGKLLLKAQNSSEKFISGIPPVYGLHTIDDIVD